LSAGKEGGRALCEETADGLGGQECTLLAASASGGTQRCPISDNARQAHWTGRWGLKMGAPSTAGRHGNEAGADASGTVDAGIPEPIRHGSPVRGDRDRRAPAVARVHQSREAMAPGRLAALAAVTLSIAASAYRHPTRERRSSLLSHKGQ